MGVDAEMFVRTMARVTPADIKLWSYQLAAAFSVERFNISKDGDDPHHCLSIVKDGEIQLEDTVLKAGPGETFIEVHFLCVRYYGPEYERGDFPFLVTVAEWLERKIPQAKVWYGSWHGMEPFGREQREELFGYFVEHGYFPFLDMVPEVTCDFCGFAMFGGGGGGRVWSYLCPGCNAMKQTQDGGRTWLTRETHRGCRRD